MTRSPATNPGTDAQKRSSAKVDLSKFIERTKNYGIIKKPDGSTSIKCTLSFKGSVRNCIASDGKDSWGIKEAERFFYIAREAWLNGDLETVADFFGVLV